MTHLTEQVIDTQALLAAPDPADGALLLFAGAVRASNEGRAVRGIHYSAHRRLAEQSLAQICAQVERDFAIRRCQIVHRLGELIVGEISVAVLVQGPHRDATYAASRFAIDKLKAETPIWKQERYLDGDCAYLDGTTLAQAR